MAAMSFEIWLFAIKGLAQTYDMTLKIYDQLSEPAKEELKNEYEIYKNSVN